jgi:hypothetical protein
VPCPGSSGPPLYLSNRPQPSIAHRTSRFQISSCGLTMTSAVFDQPSIMPRGRKRRDVTGKIEGRKFVCDNAGCGRSFTRAEHLQRHLLNHSTGEHTCDRCRAHFKRRDLLGKKVISYCLCGLCLHKLRSPTPHTSSHAHVQRGWIILLAKLLFMSHHFTPSLRLFEPF